MIESLCLCQQAEYLFDGRIVYILLIICIARFWADQIQHHDLGWWKNGWRVKWLKYYSYIINSGGGGITFIFSFHKTTLYVIIFKHNSYFLHEIMVFTCIQQQTGGLCLSISPDDSNSNVLFAQSTMKFLIFQLWSFRKI